MNKCQKFIRNLYIMAAVICFAGCGLSPNILEGHTYALAEKTITASFSADTVAINDIGALPYSLSGSSLTITISDADSIISVLRAFLDNDSSIIAGLIKDVSKRLAGKSLVIRGSAADDGSNITISSIQITGSGSVVLNGINEELDKISEYGIKLERIS